MPPNRIPAEKSFRLTSIARNLEEQAERLGQEAKNNCSHQDAKGKLVVTPTHNQCWGCRAIVSFTVNGEIIYNPPL